MYPGRQPGSRTVQGLTIKSLFEKLCASAEQEHERYTRSAVRHWRIKTVQNLASAAILTIAATAVLRLTLGSTSKKWPFLFLAVLAILWNGVLVTRRHPEAEAAHFLIARRYAALAASCRASVTKYEQSLIEDSGFQALLDKHAADLADLKSDADASLSLRYFLPRLQRLPG
jgi:hypothetical protein